MSRKQIVLALAALGIVAVNLDAHRQWMLPSATVLSVKDGWVTIDAAVSNELFYFDHVPLRLNNLVITAPDGTTAQPENASTGKYRSTFDVHLTQQGTYRVALINNTVFATWKENGEPKNWRGTADAFKKEVPANAAELKTSKMSSRVEVFVTSGKPTTKAIEPTGTGLELVAGTHPNDLVSNEPANFQLLSDGKPAANLDVTIIPGGIRYRDKLNEMKVTTGADGKFTVKFPAPGMYWLNATTGMARGGGPGGPGGGNPSGPAGEGLGGGPAAQPQRPAGGGPGGPMRMPMGDRANYVATLEVLPQ